MKVWRNSAASSAASNGGVERALWLGIALSVAFVMAMLSPVKANAAMGVSGFHVAPSTTASSAATNLDVSFSRTGNLSDDLRNTNLDLPTGLGFSVASVPKCSEASFSSDTCPSASIVGTTTADARADLLGLILADGTMTGTVYALTSNQLGVVYRPSSFGKIFIRQNLAGAPTPGGIEIATSNWPRTARLWGFLNVSLTIDSVEIDYQARSGAGNDQQLVVSNPSECGPAVSSLLATPYSGSSVTASSTYVVSGCETPDEEAPVVTITSPSEGEDFAVNSAVVNYTATDNVGVTACTINDGDSVALTPGANAIVVTCSDAAGNNGSDIVNVTYTEPVVPPATDITSYANPSFGTPPSGAPTNPAAPPLEVSFTGSSVTGFECRVDAGAWSACSSPWTVPTVGLISPAEHTYEVRAVNGATPDATPELGYFWYDNRNFTATPTVAAVPNGLEPTAADANDSGAHPNISATLDVVGYDDPESLNVVGPDGLAVSIKAVDASDRCSLASFKSSGTCPASAKIGELSGTVQGAIDGQVSASGDLFLIDPVIDPVNGMTTDDAAGVALVMDDITGPVSGDLGDIVAMGTLRINDNGRNLRILLSDFPNETSSGFRFHLLSTTLELSGDTRPDMGATPSESNPALLTNPHQCLTTLAGRPNFRNFVGTGTGHNGSTTPTIIANYIVDNCPAQAFSPTTDYSLSSTAAGSETALTAELSIPYDDSTMRSMQTTFPSFLGLNYAGVGGSGDVCPISTRITTSGQQRFDYDNPSFPCPAQARAGSVVIESPLVEGPIFGEVWLTGGGPAPWLGVKIDSSVTHPDYPGEANPQGLEIGILVATNIVDIPNQPVGCNPFGDPCESGLQLTVQSGYAPDLPLSSIELTLGDVPGRAGVGSVTSDSPLRIASSADPTCRDSGGNVTSVLIPWRGPPNVTLTNPLAPTGCVVGNVVPPVVSITSPIDGSALSAASVAVTYTVTDDVDPSPDCSIASGDSVPLVDGSNTITVTCEDSSGNSASDSVTVENDWPTPTVTITNPIDGSTTTSSSAVVNYTVSDPSDPAPSCDIADGASVALVEGANTIVVSCTNDLGATGSDSVTVTYDAPDVLAPVVTIITPLNGTVTSQSSIAVSYVVTDNEVPPPTCDFVTGSNFELVYGANVITITCEDAAGNVGTASIVVIYDNVTPEVAITSPTDGQELEPGNYPLTYTVSDLDPAPSCDFTSGDDVFVAPGGSTFTVTCTDWAGNVGQDSVSVVNPEIPVIPDTDITSYANPSAGTPASGPASPALNVAFTGTESPTGFECRVDAGAWSACSSPWTVPVSGLTSPAEHTYEVRAVNGAGPDPTPELGYFWYDNRVFTATPSVAAVPNSLEPTAADANDSGAHPNISATLAVVGYDDPQSVNIVSPDGLMGSLKSIDELDRCDLANFKLTGMCPASAKIGEMSGTAQGAIDGQVSASGDLFLIDPVNDPPNGMTADDAAGVALVMDDITGPVSGDLGDIVAMGTLRINDSGRNLRIIVPEVPRETSTGFRFHALSSTMTLFGDIRPDMSSPPSAANPALLTNPHQCLTSLAGRTNFRNFVGTGTGYNGSTTPTITASYIVDNCPAQGWNPAIDYSLSSTAAGSETALTTELSIPYDHSTLRILQATMPSFLSTNSAGLGGSADQCPVNTRITTSGQQRFDYNNPSFPCPPQAKVGTVDLESPLIDGIIKGDAWLINASPIPWIGIRIDPAVDSNNPQGVKIGLVATTNIVDIPDQPVGCDPFGDPCESGIQATIPQGYSPDVPLTSVTLNLGDITGRAGVGGVTSDFPLVIANQSDPTCRNSGGNVTTLLGGWKGLPTVTRINPLAPTGCDFP